MRSKLACMFAAYMFVPCCMFAFVAYCVAYAFCLWHTCSTTVLVRSLVSCLPLCAPTYLRICRELAEGSYCAFAKHDMIAICVFCLCCLFVACCMFVGIECCRLSLCLCLRHGTHVLVPVARLALHGIFVHLHVLILTCAYMVCSMFLWCPLEPLVFQWAYTGTNQKYVG